MSSTNRIESILIENQFIDIHLLADEIFWGRTFFIEVIIGPLSKRQIVIVWCSFFYIEFS